MTQEHLQRLHKLETSIEKIKEAQARASERLVILREQRDKHIAELSQFGISPKTAQAQLKRMADEIDEELLAIEAQIPISVEELLASEEHIRDRE